MVRGQYDLEWYWVGRTDSLLRIGSSQIFWVVYDRSVEGSNFVQKRGSMMKCRIKLRSPLPPCSARDSNPDLQLLHSRKKELKMIASCASSSAVSVSRKVAVRSTLVGSPGALRYPKICASKLAFGKIRKGFKKVWQIWSPTCFY